MKSISCVWVWITPLAYKYVVTDCLGRLLIIHHLSKSSDQKPRAEPHSPHRFCASVTLQCVRARGRVSHRRLPVLMSPRHPAHSPMVVATVSSLCCQIFSKCWLFASNLSLSLFSKPVTLSCLDYDKLLNHTTVISAANHIATAIILLLLWILLAQLSTAVNTTTVATDKSSTSSKPLSLTKEEYCPESFRLSFCFTTYCTIYYSLSVCCHIFMSWLCLLLLILVYFCCLPLPLFVSHPTLTGLLTATQFLLCSCS